MHFRFLGTGTSAGIPSLACDCAVCISDDPRDRRLRTSGLIRFTDPTGTPRAILIDAGPDLRQQALAARLDRLDAILFTHNHVDHTFGLDEVRRFNLVMGGPLDIYAEPRTLEHLRRVYQHIFDKARNVQPSFIASLIAHTIGPDQELDLFGVRVRTLRLLHGKLPVLGFLFDVPEPNAFPDHARAHIDALFPLAYCTDVSAIPPETWPGLAGLRTLVLDALRLRRHATHFTLGQALSVIHEADPHQAFLVHMSHDIGHAEISRTLPARVCLAYDGLELPTPPPQHQPG
ncbi:MAG: MBL fold metallo-hydrolase [Planctomycetota bacterium]